LLQGEKKKGITQRRWGGPSFESRQKDLVPLKGRGRDQKQRRAGKKKGGSQLARTEISKPTNNQTNNWKKGGGGGKREEGGGERLELRQSNEKRRPLELLSGHDSERTEKREWVAGAGYILRNPLEEGKAEIERLRRKKMRRLVRG